ncbi:DUF2207 domain-containing protein [Microbacterium invictum]|uniref:DUF2207 domain-containing protein n=1 Tax=Microbacterium invictum TaxID=515415 RepID=A0ABZ0VBT5_9MICO|nr:DUF2207 domain-containing protein [Microbacterium invictum]WQB71078.1 DUF2207 domain-containing protein [Microbacterium invictum]
MRRPPAVALIVAAGVAVLSDPAAASISTDPEGVVVQSLSADLTLGRGQDGVSALTVAETYVVDLSDSGRGGEIRREVSESFEGAPRHPRVISITDADGGERPREAASAGGVYSMTARADEAERGDQTFVFTYTVDGVVSVGDENEGQELAWAVTGADRSPAIGEVGATFRVPAPLVPSLSGEHRCVLRSAGSEQACDLEVTPGQLGAVLFEASIDELTADETMTLFVGFAPGTFTAADEASGAWVAVVLVVVCATAVGAAVWVVVARRRTPRTGPELVP